MQPVRISPQVQGVEDPEDAGAHSKLPPAVSGKKRRDVPSSALRLCEQTMWILGDVNARNLKLFNTAPQVSCRWRWCVYSARSPEIHHQLLVFVDVRERCSPGTI